MVAEHKFGTYFIQVRKIWTYISTFPVARDAAAGRDVTECVEARGATAP